MKQNPLIKRIIKNWRLYFLLILPVLYIIIFAYYPMIGAQIAFRNFKPRDGIWGSEWIGLRYFKQFLSAADFTKVLRNTINLSIYGLIAGFPIPIAFALALKYIKDGLYKKSVQMISYAPNFISVVVLCGMLTQFLNPRIGAVNNIIALLGMERIDFLAEPGMFPHLYVWSGIWQYTGFNSIIFLAALSGINPELHEAAIMDGANKLKRIWHIDIPGIIPTAIILLILSLGQILNVGFEKVFLLQTPLNMRSSEIIATYVYKIGLVSNLPNYSYATAVGLFQSLVGLVLLLTVNWIARRINESSLF